MASEVVNDASGLDLNVMPLMTDEPLMLNVADLESSGSAWLLLEAPLVEVLPPPTRRLGRHPFFLEVLSLPASPAELSILSNGSSSSSSCSMVNVM